VVLLGVLALAACTSGDAEGGEVTAPPSPPATSQTLTAQPTDEPTATGEAVAPPEMPAEAREQTAAGATAFASFWFEAVEHAYASGDSSMLSDLAGSSCTACDYVIDSIAELNADGHRAVGVSFDLRGAAAPPPDDRGTIVSMGLVESASHVVDASGEVVEESAETDLVPITVYVQAVEDEWRIFDIGVVE